MEQTLDQSLELHQEQTQELDHFQLLKHCPSVAMQVVTERVLRFAPRESNVLVVGESGVGKEHVARALHEQHYHRNGAFIAVNCGNQEKDLFGTAFFGHEKGAFTGACERQTGHFENANGGTLFLDEISTLPLEHQPRLLRVIEERTFQRIGSAKIILSKFRLIVASNENLVELVKRGRFREDLYFRLNVLPIRVPPLRDRQADIPYFAEYFLREFAEDSVELSPDARDALCAHSWPGNVRELRNVIERGLGDVGHGALLCARHLEFDSAPDQTKQPTSLLPEAAPVFPVAPQMELHRLIDTGALEKIERFVIERRLELQKQNRTQTAKSLDVNIRTLRNKLKAYAATANA